MVRLLIPFAGGILSCILWDRSFLAPWGMICGLFAVNGFLLLIGYQFISFKRKWIIGAFLQVLLFLLGFQLAGLEDKSSSGLHFRNLADGSATLTAKVKEPMIAGENSHKTILECLFIVDSGVLTRCHGKMLAYFQTDTLSADLRYGDVIIFNGSWQVLEGPKMPGGFNYRQYMEYQGVYDRVYLASNSWNRTGANRGNPIIALSLLLQQKIVKGLQTNGLKGNELAIAGAILAGYREALDRETEQAFSGAGAMHILCVSGLHVGVIYLVLSSVLGLLLKDNRTRFLKFILLISSIWMYALVTGCSPSVLRASTMISFLVAGRLLRSNTNIYNTLAASAFLLLLADPMMIMSIGFQLSYMAVLGIVSIQPVLYKLVYLKYWLPDRAWAIITVSIGAQAGTFPLAIYYFHQFPTYFMLTNLIVIPASSLIIYLGLMMLLCTPFAWLGAALCWVLGKTIYLMDGAVLLINKLPGSVADGLYTGPADTVLIYLLITLTLSMVIYHKKQLIWANLLLLFTLILTFSWRKYNQVIQAEFIVHATPGHQAYEFIAGRDHYLFVDSDEQQILSEIGFHAGGYWIRNGLGPPRLFRTSYLQKDTMVDQLLFIKQGFVNFSGKKIFFPERQEIHGAGPLKMELDILVLSGSPKFDFSHLEESSAIGALVFDGTVDRRQASTWRAACDASGWAYHDVTTEGAFICNLD